MSLTRGSCADAERKSQAVAEMLVRNESRIKMIHDIQHFHVPRQLLHTIRIRLEVRAPTSWPLPEPEGFECPVLLSQPARRRSGTCLQPALMVMVCSSRASEAAETRGRSRWCMAS